MRETLLELARGKHIVWAWLSGDCKINRIEHHPFTVKTNEIQRDDKEDR